MGGGAHERRAAAPYPVRLVGDAVVEVWVGERENVADREHGARGEEEGGGD